MIAQADKRRLDRQAKALAVVKAIRRSDDPEAPLAQPKRPNPLKHTELPGTDADAPGFVYFAYCAGRIKIGYTTDVKQRMEQLSGHSPMPVTLLLTVKGWPSDEEDFHYQFADDRVHREWFAPSLDLREFLSLHFECGSGENFLNAEVRCYEYFFRETAKIVDMHGRELCDELYGHTSIDPWGPTITTLAP
jgi:hypothetical protein